jgi:SAM-dependent methyltransferase
VDFTGERVIPGQGDVDLLNEHRARYWFARRYAAGKIVLDAACGTGYGSALLAETAQSVVGVDIARDAVEYARRHFHSPKIRYAQADCLALPFTAGHFDLIVAFEIIEHLENPEAFLAELRRVLHPSGLLILSTPNRLYYTDDRGEINPFHQREFSYPEFEEILRPLFAHRAILFENHVAGLAVTAPGARPDFAASPASRIFQEETSASSVEAERRGTHFFVALCSARPLQPIEPFLYLPSAGNVLREREIHIHRLLEEIQPLRQHLKELDQRLSEKGSYVLQLQDDYNQKIEWAQSLERDLEKARADLDQLRREFDERTAWALRLDAELQARSEDLQLLFGSRWYRLGKNLKLSPVPPSDHGAPESGSR